MYGSEKFSDTADVCEMDEVLTTSTSYPSF
jgi:hypothetical protein